MKKDITLADLMLRVEKLEHAVYGGKTLPRKKTKIEKPQEFKGATGGLRLLIANGFFDKRRNFSEVKIEIEKHGYLYSKQAINDGLSRLSKIGGPLASLKEKGGKIYAKRR